MVGSGLCSGPSGRACSCPGSWGSLYGKDGSQDSAQDDPQPADTQGEESQVRPPKCSSPSVAPQKDCPRPRAEHPPARTRRRAGVPGLMPRSRKGSAASRPSIRSRSASCNMSPRSPCWWRWSCPRRRPMPASTRRRRRCSRPPTRRPRWRRSARSGCATDQDHRPLPHQGEELIALSTQLIERHGGEVPRTARSSRPCPVSAARPPMWCSISRSASHHRGRYPHFPHRQPHRPRDRQNAVRGRGKLERRCRRKYKPHAHHWLILHGRYVCVARQPRCEKCLIVDLCKWPAKTI